LAHNQLPGSDDLRQFHEDARVSLQDRSGLVHAMVYADFPEEEGKAMRWVLHSPRSGTDRPLPDDAEVGELLARMDALCARAIGLGSTATDRLADYLRTEDADEQ